MKLLQELSSPVKPSRLEELMADQVLDYVFYNSATSGEIPDGYVKEANRALKKLFDIPVGAESTYLLNNATKSVFCISINRAPTRARTITYEVAAFVTLEIFDGKPYIGWLVTMPKYQKRGIATNLIKLLQSQTNVLTLHEDSTNKGLTNFYDKLGFRVVPAKSRFVPRADGSLLEQYFMMWRYDEP